MKSGPACLLVAAGALLPYLLLPTAPVLYDGEPAILMNAALRSGPVAEIPLLDFWGQPTQADYSMRSWRPLVSLTWALELRAFGASAALLHLTDMLLHAVASALVVLVLAAWGIERRWLVPAGLVFALHPVQVDAVASAAGRADLMAACCLFGALVLLHGLGAAARPALRRAALFLLVAAGLLSKEYAVSFPFVLLAADCLGGRDDGHRVDLRAHAGSFAMLGLYLVARVALFGGLGAAPASPALHPLAGATLAVRWATSFALVPLALRLLFLPYALNHHYRFGTLAIPEGWLDPRALLGLALVALVVAGGALAWRKRADAPALATALFLFPVFPCLHFFGVVGVVFAERFLYIPTAGLALAAGWLLPRIAARAASRGLVAPALAIVLVTLAALTVQRTSDWRSMERLARSSLASYPNGAEVWKQLGVALLRDGRDDEALAAVERAIELNPRDAQAYSVHADVLEREKRYGDAAAALRKVVDLAPGEPGVVLRDLGRVELLAGRAGDAIEPLSRAREAMPADAKSLYLLAEAYLRAGDPEGAVRALEGGEAAMQTDPDSLRPLLAQAMLRAGQTRATAGQKDEALFWTRRAVATGSMPAAGWFLAGLVARAAGDAGYSRGLFDRALALDPDLLAQKHEAAERLAADGDTARAIALFEEILIADPGREESSAALARARAASAAPNRKEAP